MWKQLRYGEKVAGFSALGLFAVLFLDWFGAEKITVDAHSVRGNSIGFFATVHVGGSGWHTLGWLALALCVLAIAAGLALPFVFALHDSPVLPIVSAILASLFGILAVIALIVQDIWQPGPDQLVEVKSGWWLGLLAAVGVARGGFLSMRDEYMPAVALADVEVRPAPAA